VPRVSVFRRTLFNPANVSLNSIVDLEKLSQEPPERIKEIWMEYHKTLDCISAVIPTQTYDHMRSRALAAPNFVVPLPRETGFLNTFFQARDHCLLFTSLAKYKEAGLNSAPWLTIRNFVEFKDRGIVLMRGETLGGHLTSLEAQYLYNQLRLYLFEESKYKLMLDFNKNPTAFSFEQVIKEMATL